MDTLDRCLPAANHSQQGVRNTSSMDLDLEMKRKYLRDQIYQKLVQQRPQMTPDMQPKMKDIVKRLEECLFESAKEEYMNMDTLDQRLDTLIRRLPAANHSQQGLRNTSSMNLDLEMKSKYLRDQMCHDVEQIIEERERHPINSRDKHALYPLREMLDLMVHASQCRFPQCPYPNCRRVKGLFHHGQQCRTRASGGCVLCKKMWYIHQLHARYCKESECHVPRCREMKEHLRRLQQQSLGGELQ